MTRDEILQLQPGDPLDLLVAESLEPMPTYIGSDIDGSVSAGSVHRGDGKETSDGGMWWWSHRVQSWYPYTFSTSATAALRLWDAIVGMKINVLIDRRHDDSYVEILRYPYDETATRYTWMHALCLAWLLWCEAHP